MSEFDQQNPEDGPDLLAVELARGSNVRDAAKACDVSESTVHRRLRDPGFKRQVSELRGRMVDEAAGRLSEATIQAVDRLVTLLKSGSDSIALSAARAIVENMVNLRKTTELEERILTLEEKLSSQGQRPRPTPWRPASAQSTGEK